MSSSHFTPDQLRHFAEQQYRAQWEDKYSFRGSYPYFVVSGKLSDEQLAAMLPHVETLLHESESSGRYLLNRLDFMTKHFFVEWLNNPGCNGVLMKERHPLHWLSIADIRAIFALMHKEHQGGNLLGLQSTFVEACHQLDHPRPWDARTE